MMKRKYICFTIALVAGAMLGCFLYSWCYPWRKVDETDWVQLKQGMTKSQVCHLLGFPASRHFDNPVGRSRYGYYNYWQYKVPTSDFVREKPLMNDSKAYVIHFDKTEQVVRWRKPGPYWQTYTTHDYDKQDTAEQSVGE